MAANVTSFPVLSQRFKPHILIALTQLCYTFMFFVTEASFNNGMNPHVHITYRLILSGIITFPFAYFLERDSRPKLTVALFMEIFVLSLMGVSLTLNLYFASLRCTSPTFVASVTNTIASLTFIIAVSLRMEVMDIRSPRGMAKVLGTLVSLGGVMVMTFYKGTMITNLWQPRIHFPHKVTIHEQWFKGSVLTISSCITASIWYIMQAFTLKRYPAQLSLTTWMSLVGAAQSAAYTILVQHKSEAWKVGLNIDLWAILYAGMVCSALAMYIQLWCTEEKGPVFVTMFNPLSTLLVAVLAYFIFGEKLYLGSIFGGVMVILGLYLLLWGKEAEQQLQPTNINENMKQKPNFQMVVSHVNHVFQDEP